MRPCQTSRPIPRGGTRVGFDLGERHQYRSGRRRGRGSRRSGRDSPRLDAINHILRADAERMTGTVVGAICQNPTSLQPPDIRNIDLLRLLQASLYEFAVLGSEHPPPEPQSDSDSEAAAPQAGEVTGTAKPAPRMHCRAPAVPPKHRPVK